MPTTIKQWMLALGLVCGQMLAGAPTADAKVVSNTWNTTTPFTFFDTCSLENVTLVIDTHIVTRLIGEAPDGTRYFRTHVNFQGDGAGAISGKKYVYNGSTQREFSLAPGCVGSGETENYTRLISQGSSDNRYLRSVQGFVASPTGPGGSCIFVPAGPPTFLAITCNG